MENLNHLILVIKIKKEGLYIWFKQEWLNQRGEVGYKKDTDIYRPTKIYGKTPILMKDLTKEQIKKAEQIKKSGKRINNFKKLCV